MLEESRDVCISGGWRGGVQLAVSWLRLWSQETLFCVSLLFKHGEGEAGCNPDGKTALARCIVGFNSLLSFQDLLENPGGWCENRDVATRPSDADKALWPDPYHTLAHMTERNKQQQPHSPGLHSRPSHGRPGLTSGAL